MGNLWKVGQRIGTYSATCTPQPPPHYFHNQPSNTRGQPHDGQCGRTTMPLGGCFGRRGAIGTGAEG